MRSCRASRQCLILRLLNSSSLLSAFTRKFKGRLGEQFRRDMQSHQTWKYPYLV
jgi:hypothetical protein